MLLSAVAAAARSELPRTTNRKEMPDDPPRTTHAKDTPGDPPQTTCDEQTLHDLPPAIHLPDYEFLSAPDSHSVPVLYGLPMPSIPGPVLPEFIMPDRTRLVPHVLYNRFRRQEGITIPAHSVLGGRMLGNSGGYMPFYDRSGFRLNLAGSRLNYTSFGFSNSLSLGYSYSPAERITFYGNLYASDNMYHLTRFKDFGISGRVRVRLADRLFVNGYGNYSIYNNGGGQQFPMGISTPTSYGGTIEVKITDKFGLEGGVMREYDPFRRKWNTTPYLMPVFY